jgi:ribosomal protein S27AE
VAGFLPGSPAADDAALLTSELVTNAVLHSASGLPGGTVTVSVRAENGSVRVDVIDQGQVPPRMAAPGGLGKGLAIVSQLADVFGADGPDRWFWLRSRSDKMPDLAPDDEACPRCGAVSWAQVPDGRLECTRCLWSEPSS